jgi:hypothetical protein
MVTLRLALAGNPARENLRPDSRGNPTPTDQRHRELSPAEARLAGDKADGRDATRAELQRLRS